MLNKNYINVAALRALNRSPLFNDAALSKMLSLLRGNLNKLISTNGTDTTLGSEIIKNEDAFDKTEQSIITLQNFAFSTQIFSGTVEELNSIQTDNDNVLMLIPHGISVPHDPERKWLAFKYLYVWIFADSSVFVNTTNSLAATFTAYTYISHIGGILTVNGDLLFSNESILVYKFNIINVLVKLLSVETETVPYLDNEINIDVDNIFNKARGGIRYSINFTTNVSVDLSNLFATVITSQNEIVL